MGLSVQCGSVLSVACLCACVGDACYGQEGRSCVVL